VICSFADVIGSLDARVIEVVTRPIASLFVERSRNHVPHALAGLACG